MDKPATTAPPKTLKDWIASKEFKDQVALALPKHMTPDRFLRVALTSINRKPEILKCTKESVLQCLLDCSSMGIEADGRRAHLIPFGNECKLVLDYKGIAELVRRSGDVSYIHADVVGDADVFDFSHGSKSFLDHRPNLKGRGNIICAYSFVRLKDGSEDFDVMSLDEIERIKERSRGYIYAVENKKQHPWMTDWNEMAKKTVFKRHSKWLPLSPDLKEKIDKDFDQAIDVESTTEVKESKLLGNGKKKKVEPEDPVMDEDDLVK